MSEPQFDQAVAQDADPLKLSDENVARDILVAYLSRNEVSPSELPSLIREVRRALAEPEIAECKPPTSAASSMLARSEHLVAIPAAQRPTVAVEATIHQDHLICLEDGKSYRSLKRLLMHRYGMTPDDYRRKWNLPPDYPMVAPSYAAERSLVAKRIGLGRASNEVQQPSKSKARKY